MGVVVRDKNGRYGPGNRSGVGHGGAAHELARFRRIALESTTEQDMRDVWSTLVSCAKAGEPWAVHEFLDRTHGKAQAPPPEAAEEHARELFEYWQDWGARQAGPAEDASFEVKSGASEELSGG